MRLRVCSEVRRMAAGHLLQLPQPLTVEQADVGTQFAHDAGSVGEVRRRVIGRAHRIANFERGGRPCRHDRARVHVCGAGRPVAGLLGHAPGHPFRLHAGHRGGNRDQEPGEPRDEALST